MRMIRFFFFILIWLLIVASTDVVLAVEILSPVTDASFRPGDVMTVRIVPSIGEEIQQATVVTASSEVAATPSSDPSIFEAQVTMPREAVGPTFIAIVTNLEGGETLFDYVRVVAEPGVLSKIYITAPLNLTGVGEVAQVFVSGEFADEVVRDLTLPEDGTTYSSSNDAVLGVHPSGLIQARSNGTASVSITNRGQKASADVEVKIQKYVTNHIPIVNAGEDQIVSPEQVVTLSGISSRDPDNDPLSYWWEQESGRFVVLVNANAAEPSFLSPRVNAEEIIEFSLVVTDDKGAMSFPDIVRIIVRP